MSSRISVSIREVLMYHSIECRVFERLLRMGCSRDDAQRLTALWMWLERIGFDNLLATVRDAPDDRAVRYLREGEAILDVIQVDAPPPADHPRSLPLTTAMGTMKQPVSLRYFYVNRDVVIQGIVDFMNSIGRLVFDDALRRLMATDPNNPALSRRYERGQESSPEYQRTMLVMFDRGTPVSKEQIQEYFISRWGGDCIERVVVEGTTPGVPSLYGRVVFTTAAYLELALNRQQQTELVISGKKLWGFRPMNNGFCSRISG